MSCGKSFYPSLKHLSICWPRKIWYSASVFSVYSTGSGVLIKTFKVGFSPFDQKFTWYITGWMDVSGHDGDVNPAGLHKVGGSGSYYGLHWKSCQKAYAEKKEESNRWSLLCGTYICLKKRKKQRTFISLWPQVYSTPTRTRWGAYTFQHCV